MEGLSVSKAFASAPRCMASLDTDLVHQIFEYLPFSDQIRMKYVCRAWWDIAQSCGIVNIANGVSVEAFTALDDHGEISEEYEHMNPVIARNPHRWIPPNGCILFEPYYGGHRYHYHAPRYTPSQIMIRWPGLATPYQ